MLKKFCLYLESVFFPPDCPFCEKIMDYREAFVCLNCLQKLPFIVEPRCLCCGKNVEEENKYCKDCEDLHHVFEEGRAVFKYEGMVARAILKFKYHGRKDFGDVFSYWMVRCLKTWINEKRIDVIVPVAVHKNRMRKRGYNQAAILAEKMAKELKIEYNNYSVIRHKNTVPQKKLTILERMRNMQKAFKVVDGELKNKRVLIVDDIYTTGMTVDIMSLCILESGADKVYFASLSQGE